MVAVAVAGAAAFNVSEAVVVIVLLIHRCACRASDAVLPLRHARLQSAVRVIMGSSRVDRPVGRLLDQVTNPAVVQNGR